MKMDLMNIFNHFVFAAILVSLLTEVGMGQTASPPQAVTPATLPPVTAKQAEAPPTPQKLDVIPAVRDEQIRERLQSILLATNWFTGPVVEVRNGVVILTGTAERDDYKLWATTLANNTQDVATVINKMEIARSSIWSLAPVIDGFSEMWIGFLHALPSIVAAMIILFMTWLVARFTRRIADYFLKSRIEVPLLRDVISRALVFVVVIVGIYFVLRVSGLTRLALTVLGGTGLFGLILGVAFRDIAENFLASILLSVQRPFKVGDLVEIVGTLGYIDRLTIRTTIINTVDGNYVQIPNAVVYKSNIRNFTNNPNRRDEFAIGIGYANSLSKSQDIAMHVLKNHPDVLKTPEPSVLVDHFTPALVELKVYFWTNSRIANPLAVRSSLLRLIGSAFQENGIIVGSTAPAAPTQVIFPNGVPMRMLPEKEGKQQAKNVPPNGADLVERKADHEMKIRPSERSLNNESQMIKEQSVTTDPRETSENLLATSNHEPVHQPN